MIRIRCVGQAELVELDVGPDNAPNFQGIIRPILPLMFLDEVIPAGCIMYYWSEKPEPLMVKPEDIFALNYASESGRFAQVGCAIKFLAWSEQ